MSTFPTLSAALFVANVGLFYINYHNLQEARQHGWPKSWLTYFTYLVLLILAVGNIFYAYEIYCWLVG